MCFLHRYVESVSSEVCDGWYAYCVHKSSAMTLAIPMKSPHKSSSLYNDDLASFNMIDIYFFRTKIRKTQIHLGETTKGQCIRASPSEGYLVPLLAMCGGG